MNHSPHRSSTNQHYFILHDDVTQPIFIQCYSVYINEVTNTPSNWFNLHSFIPPTLDHIKIFYIFSGKFLNFWRPFLVIFHKFCLVSSLEDHQKNFANFPNFLTFPGSRTEKDIPISICNLVVTKSMKRYQILVHSFGRNQPEWSGVDFCSILFCFIIVMTHLCSVYIYVCLYVCNRTFHLHKIQKGL